MCTNVQVDAYFGQNGNVTILAEMHFDGNQKEGQ